ncbi:MAG: hypothetical protein ING36_10445 [Burkholderiales bacterium]|jgi:hypothetical protein|nr:hypothetical protein [Burkholderiales bacterium]MCA3157419.1 hypothetical protein [Burkholderiales bacterium]MCA3175943.1 hypothetical protein [Burkholderiales bacterium]MCA6471553.1 hypothetical protein [Chitinophagaceae bacterium]
MRKSLISIDKKKVMRVSLIKNYHLSKITLQMNVLAIFTLSIFLVGCDNSKSSTVKKDFIELNGVRHSITTYDITDGFNNTLNQQEIKLKFFQQKNSIGTLSLGLEGNPSRVVRAGVCIIYGNGVFQYGEKNGALCVSGSSVVSAVNWENQNADSPKLEFKWNGTVGKEDIPAQIQFSTTSVTRN